MQTFLPHSDFAASANCLDNKRLGKQRVEAYQILRTLYGVSRGWENHPAVRMWRGYEVALGLYMNACIEEWVKRGFNNNMLFIPSIAPCIMPPWFGNAEFHASHRSNLLRKDPKWYSQFGWLEPADLPYVWPVD